MLNKIGEETRNWSTILVHMVCSRLDSTTLRHWESHHNSKEVPSFDNLMEFLRDQCSVLQSIVPTKLNDKDERRPRFSVTHSSTQSQRRCVFCDDCFHMPFKCNKLQNMSVSQRVEEVNRKRLCRNCLCPGHFADGCARGSCSRCGRKHHTLLHADSRSGVFRVSKPSITKVLPPSTSQPQDKSHLSNQQQPLQNRSKPTSQTTTLPAEPIAQSHPTTSYTIIQTRSKGTHPPPNTSHPTTTTLKTIESPRNSEATRQVLMSTAVVRVVDRFGNAAFARTLLDSCSEFCYMTSSFSKKLKLREKPDFLKVQGIGDSSATSTKSVQACVQARVPSISSFNENMQFHVLPRITQMLPLKPVRFDIQYLPTGMVLADPLFWEPGPREVKRGIPRSEKKEICERK